MLNDEEAIKTCFDLNQSTGDVTLSCQTENERPNMVSLHFAATDGFFVSRETAWVNLTFSKNAIDLQCRSNPQSDILTIDREETG